MAQVQAEFGVDFDRLALLQKLTPMERLEKHYRAVRNVVMLREAANSRRSA